MVAVELGAKTSLFQFSFFKRMTIHSLHAFLYSVY